MRGQPVRCGLVYLSWCVGAETLLLKNTLGSPEQRVMQCAVCPWMTCYASPQWNARFNLGMPSDQIDNLVNFLTVNTLITPSDLLTCYSFENNFGIKHKFTKKFIGDLYV